MTRKSLLLVATVGLVTLLYGASPASAQSAPPLGAVKSFGVLGGSAVTAAGAAGTVIDGDVGSAPTPSVSGFPPAVVTAGFTVFKAANATTTQARLDATTARVNLAGQVCPAGNHIAAGTLGGLNLVPGVYCMPTGDLTGTLTLTGGAAGATDVWVFQMTLDTLTTAGASKVVMAGGASACNVYWQVSSSATLGAASSFSGSIFSGASIGLGTTADIKGRAIAGSGAVTLDGSDTIGGCSGAPACPIITLAPSTLPTGKVGVAYSQQITASGGTGPYVFSVVSGTLPAGLTLSSGGLLSGTPTAAGSSPVTITATDGSGCPGVISYTIVIAAATCPVITLAPPALPTGQVGVAYSQQITASGGAGSVVFTVLSGTLPAGLTLTAGGLLSGTPTTAASSTVVIQATDGSGCPGVITYTIGIVAATCPVITLSPPTLPNGTVGVVWSQTLTVSGGTAPYSFSVTAGTLPPGLTLASAGPLGLLSGTPTAAGTSTFTIRVTDANGCFAERSFTMLVVTGVPTLPQAFVLLLALGLIAVGYFRLRRRARAE